MTKTAIGAAVAALTLPIAFTASAAQVQIYGLVDEGLSYISKDLDDGNSSQDFRQRLPGSRRISERRNGNGYWRRHLPGILHRLQCS